MIDALQVLLVAEFDEDADWITGFLRESAVVSNVVRVHEEEQCSAALIRGGSDVCVSIARGAALSRVLSPFGKPSKFERPPLLLMSEGSSDVTTQASRLGASVWTPSMGVKALGIAIRNAEREGQARRRRNHERAFELGQREVLEHIARGAPGSEVLDEIVRLIERQAHGMLCSILTVDAERGVVVHGAAPNLPLEFVRAIDGAKVGEGAGSCGTAAYRKEPVVVEDIATHPYWQAYRDFALPFGLKACWSSPIVSAEGAVLGTFAMYYGECRGPTPEEEAWVERATHLAAIAMVRELSEREQKRLSEAVRQSEHLRTMAYEGVSDVLFYVRVEPNGDFRFNSVNAAFLSSTGLRAEDVIGRSVVEVVPPSSLESVLGHYRLAVAERRTVTWVETSVYPAGKRYGEVAVTPVFDVDGRCTHLLGMANDMTARRQAEERIRSQAALLDRATDAIMVRSIEGVISYWNKGAERLYGYSSAEAIGRNAADFMYREPAAMLAAKSELTLRGEWAGELQQRTRDGRDIVVQARWTLLREGEFAPDAVLVINTDITEKRSLEAQVLRAQRLESLGRLAGGIAHDFNNILTAIKGNVSLALGDLEPEHLAREALSGIELAVVRAADLVRQILAFSRQEEPKRRLVSIEPVVLEALSLLRVTLPVSIDVDIRFEPDLPLIHGDPSQLHQVVVNLGTNAVQAMSARGGTLGVHGARVVLGARLVSGTTELPAGEYARLTISDTGHGMDSTTLERIFDPFFTTKEPGEGTGLGLSVAHGILKSHGGGIVVSSAPCEGASFSLYFPAAI